MSAAELEHWTRDLEQRLGYTPDPDDLRNTSVYRQPAPTGVRYAPTAFDQLVGTDVPVMGDSGVCPGRLIGTRVVEDGAAVELAIDLPMLFARQATAGGAR